MPRDPGQTDRLIRRLRWDELDGSWLLRFAEFARDEDLSGLGLAERPLRTGDPSAALLVGAARARARVVARRPMVLAGLGLLDVVFAAYGGRCHAKPLAYDGQFVPAGTAVAEVEGPASELLSAERILLNFLQRLCGVATHTREHVLALGSSPTKLLDTRKTTPGWRALEKYAVRCGGCVNHRSSLGEHVLIKDNHIAAAGSLTKAVKLCRAAAPHSAKIEVEATTLAEVKEAVRAGAKQIDGSVRRFGAGAGNAPVEALIAVFDKIGVKTGIDFFDIADAAEDVVAPAMPAECLLDRNALIMGYSGVYSSFLKHAVRQGERYGVPAHQLLHRAGQRKLIGGQEDQLIDIALEIQREQDAKP